MQIIKHLKECSLFSGMTVEGLEGFSKWWTIKKYKRKQIIFKEQDRWSSFFYLLSGKVKLYRQNYFGKIQIFHIAKENEALSYPFATGLHYPHTAEVLEDCTIAAIPFLYFQKIVNYYPEFFERALVYLSKNIYELENLIFRTANCSVENRLAYFLLSLEEKFGEGGARKRFLNIGLTQSEISQALGTTRETVSRILQRFVKEGYIEMRGKRIWISDKEKVRLLTKSKS